MPPDLGPYHTASLLAALSTLPALGAAWWRREELPHSLQLFAGYLGLELLALVAALTVIRGPSAADPIVTALLPPRTGLILLTLAAWQSGNWTGRLLRTAGLCFPLLWLPMLLGWETPVTFPLGLDTLQGLACLAVTAFVVVRRSLEGPGPAAGQDWLWIGSGIMLVSATRALAAPLSRYFDATNEMRVVLDILVVLALAQLLANLFYFRGLRAVPSSRIALAATYR